MNDSILLATFTKAKHLQYNLDLISDNFDIIGGRIFVLKDVKKPYKRILTYNVVKDGSVFSDIVKNTISLHRKKETNTLYTLNALNKVVEHQNEGILDARFAVDWDNYRNCILLIHKDDLGDSYLKRIDTALIKVID